MTRDQTTNMKDKMSGTYEDLEVWREAMDLVESVYTHTRDFPKQEQYCLTNQLRRAAVSVPSNIAEGKGRSSDKELIQFLNHARGSLYEVQTQLKIADRLHYLDANVTQTLDTQAAKVGRLLNGLIRKFQTSLKRPESI
jgi:four helix bundle protein